MNANGHWVFTDYGDGNRGGSMVDFLSLTTGLSIGEAVRWLEGFAEGKAPPLPLLHPLSQSVGSSPSETRKQRTRSGSGVEIEVVREWQANQFENSVLENELYTHRKLRFADFRDEVKVMLVLLHPHERRRFQFAIRNLSGGIEHCAAAPRSSAGGFAGNIGGKDIGLFSGDQDSLCIVEGIWDACAVKKMGWTGRILCLTSTSMAKRALDFIQGEYRKNLREVCLALDDDVSGREAAKLIIAGLSGNSRQHRLDISRLDLEGTKDPSDLWLRRADTFGGEKA